LELDGVDWHKKPFACTKTQYILCACLRQGANQEPISLKHNKENMSSIFARTFGALNRKYYLSQFMIGGTLAAIFIIKMNSGTHSLPIFAIILIAINALLYPYARYVYESTINYLMGDTLFVFNIFFLMIAKLMTIAFCFGAAILIAPIGLIYLYFKTGKLQN
jgi:hypothetical protein